MYRRISFNEFKRIFLTRIFPVEHNAYVHQLIRVILFQIHFGSGLSSKKYGLGIRDPRSGRNLFRIRIRNTDHNAEYKNYIANAVWSDVRCCSRKKDKNKFRPLSPPALSFYRRSGIAAIAQQCQKPRLRTCAIMIRGKYLYFFIFF